MDWLKKRREELRSAFVPTKTTPMDKSPEPVERADQVQRQVSAPKPKAGLVSIKDLSRDELVSCIRELESELGEPESMIDEHWGMMDLQVWLRGLEQQARGGRYTVNLSPDELEHYRVKPDDEGELL